MLHLEQVVLVLLCQIRHLNCSLRSSFSQSSLLRSNQGQVPELVTPQHDQFHCTDREGPQFPQHQFKFVHNVTCLSLLKLLVIQRLALLNDLSEDILSLLNIFHDTDHSNISPLELSQLLLKDLLHDLQV